MLRSHISDGVAPKLRDVRRRGHGFAADGDGEEHLLMVAAVIASIPCILLFFAAQRFFVRGIVMSGIKG